MSRNIESKRKIAATTLVLGIVLMLPLAASGIVFLPDSENRDITAGLPEALNRDVNDRIAENSTVTLIHQPVFEAERREDLQTVAYVEGMPEGGVLVIHYRYRNEGPYFTREVKQADDGGYVYTFPGYILTEPTLQYYFEVITATEVLAQSGDYMNPHTVLLTSKSSNIKLVLIGLLSIVGLFILTKIELPGRKVKIKVD